MANVDPVQFGGQFGYYTDTSTGEALLAHRYYDASTGHFLNRDPIGYSGGQNLYAFCGNNPITNSDPMGTDAGDWIDKYLLGGSISHWGDVQGKYDAGKASGGQLALAAASGVGQTVFLAVSIETGGAGLLRAGAKIAAARAVATVAKDASATLADRAEANAGRYLARMEAENPGAHFVSRHGTQTTLEQQYVRATTGLTPDGAALNPVNASRFLSNRVQLNAAQRAMTIFRATGQNSIRFQMEGIVGEGYTTAGEWLRSGNVQAVFRNGKLYTMYPLLRTLP